MIGLIPAPLTFRRAGPNSMPLFWGLGRKERRSQEQNNCIRRASLRCCLGGKESCLSLPVLVPAVPLSPHTHPVPGTRCFVGLNVQPGKTARVRRTGHSFSYLSSPPFPPPPFLSLFLPPFLAFAHIFIDHLLCARLCSRCWRYHCKRDGHGPCPPGGVCVLKPRQRERRVQRPGCVGFRGEFHSGLW